MFFFFQAEDGIRDATVTGVQTCALPICVFLVVGRSIEPNGISNVALSRLVRGGLRTSVLRSKRPAIAFGLSDGPQRIADTRVLFRLPSKSDHSGNASGWGWEISGWHESRGRRSAR